VPRRSPRDEPSNRRGSPEAIAKRRAGRRFNDLFDEGGPGLLDGRTQKRRQRLLQELEAGKARGSGRELKPLDVLSHVSELLELCEPLATLRKVCRTRPVPATAEPLVEVVAQLHRAYGFRPEAYRFVGIDDAVLRAAGITGETRRERPQTLRPPRGRS
jgi:hypothetical protein